MRITAVALALALLVAACSMSADDAASAAEVRLDEFTIGLDTTLVAGEVDLTVVNEGEFAHTLLVEGPDGSVVAGTDLIAPGESLDLSLDLPSGAYRVSCRIVVEAADGEIIDHFEKGMRAPVTVVDA